MWVRGQGRTLVNFDYVTQVEARVMEASYTTADREPKYEVIAYRRPPAQDAILLNMLDSKTAGAAVDRLAGAIIAESTFVDMLEILEGARRQIQQNAEPNGQATLAEDETAITPT
jgi:hypothetical protein